MTYIKTDIHQPGIVELLFYKGATGKALSKLAHTLLHGPSPLTFGERELIASYVSALNNCEFCHESHSASASVHLNDGGSTVYAVKSDPEKAEISDKMKALLKIASQVQKSGRDVTLEAIEAARQKGATDEDIHDTVLISAAFCMYNRYVDGIGHKPARGEGRIYTHGNEDGPYRLQISTSLFKEICHLDDEKE